MRILHVIGALPVGGAEKALERLVMSSKDNGWNKACDHSVVSLSELGPIGEYLISKGISVYALNLKSIFDLPFAFIRLCGLIRSVKPDVIQTWMYHADIFGGLAANFNRLPVIWGIRNTDLRPGVSRFTFFIMKVSAVFSRYVPRKIVSVAESAKAIHVSYGYDLSKFVIIHNGYDVEKFEFDSVKRKRVRELLNVNDDVILIGSVGRFNPYKDHKTFIITAEQLVKKKNNLKFLMIGKGVDASNKYLSDLISSAGLEDFVVMLGEQLDLSDYYSAMDIFCLHSISEGFPNVLAEAMACSLPVVSTLVGDALHLVGDDELFSQPASPLILAEKIFRIVEMSRFERQELGARLRQRIIDKFSLRSMVASYEEVYKSILTQESHL